MRLADDDSHKALRLVWATLTVEEARGLLDALTGYFNEERPGQIQPDWHTHVGDGDGSPELTLAIEP
jgi:hypothetical protein